MEKEISFTIQPNPAFDYLAIGGDMDAIKSIEIVDMAGRVLIHKEISIDRTIDIKSLNTGFYFCHVASRDGKIRVLKFTKL